MDELAAKIAQLETLRSTLGDMAVDAAIAALRQVDPSPTTQHIEASESSSVMSSPQTRVEGDMVANAVGSGNLVLHDITIAEGGTLVIGTPAPDALSQAEALQQALVAYLQTILERYQFLSLRGLSASGSRQVRIALRAVFVSLRTNIQIPELAKVFGEGLQQYLVERRVDRGHSFEIYRPNELTPDVREWYDELLTSEEKEFLQSLASQMSASDFVDRVLRVADRLEFIWDRFQAPRTALELIRHYRALVLLGDPGSGKTTVLRHLALGFALARLNAGSDDATVEPELAWRGSLPLPILMQLRRFADDLPGPPVDSGPLLDYLLRLLTGDRFTTLASYVQSRLEFGDLLLLLDGLDEIADDQRRLWVVQAVALFQSRFPWCRIVLTSRIYAYRDPCRLPPPFQEATLQPLDVAAQNGFIERWYRAALLQGSGLTTTEQERVASDKARDLIGALERRVRLREITANPLLLTMIALLHLHGLGLPQQRAELYQACLILLLEQWEQQHADSGSAGLAAVLGVPHRLTTTGERLALIQPIAYHLQGFGREEARQSEVKEWLLDRFLDLADEDGRHARALIERFLEFLEGRSGLLIARDLKDRYAFPHKTFQEYLAARELIYQGAEETLQQILTHRHSGPWHEVILLVVGHLVANSQPQQAKEIAWRLLEADPEGNPAYYRSMVLAGEIVEELGSNLGRDGRRLRDDVVQGLVELVHQGHLSARERVEAALLLGRLGDPRLPTPDQQAFWCSIEAGPFWHGDDFNYRTGREVPLQQVMLPYAYKIARFTVTNAQYRRFIDAGGYREQRWWIERGWQACQENDWTMPRLFDDIRFNGPTQPVVGISWYEAVAYCTWLTAQGHADGWLPVEDEIRLPTVLEWERAGRHTDKRRYPWGDEEIDVERANYRDTGIGIPAPVGCFPRCAALCGALDMIGNVEEWTATSQEAPQGRAAQKDVTPSSLIGIAYNDFRDRVQLMHCSSRVWRGPIHSDLDLGFRLVWSRGNVD